MSHTTAIKGVKIQSADVLIAAVEELAKQGKRVSIVRNEAPRAYYQGQEGMGVAPLVIKVHDAKYDIGVYGSEGNYELRTDFWGGSVSSILGGTPTKDENREQAKLGLLLKEYAIQAAMRQARSKGLQCRRAVSATGVTQLLVSGYR